MRLFGVGSNFKFSKYYTHEKFSKHYRSSWFCYQEWARGVWFLYGIVGKFRKGDVRHCFSDISKIKEKLGFQPRVSFMDGMKELMEWSEGVEAEDKSEKAAQELREKGLLDWNAKSFCNNFKLEWKPLYYPLYKIPFEIFLPKLWNYPSW